MIYGKLYRMGKKNPDLLVSLFCVNDRNLFQSRISSSPGSTLSFSPFDLGSGIRCSTEDTRESGFLPDVL